MEELDEFGIPIKKNANSSAAVDEFGIPVKKKVESTATAPPQKSVSGTTTGSSVGVKPKAPTKVVENATQKEQRLRKELSNVKVTAANMDAVSAKTDELSALQKANSKAAKQKLDATDNNIISKIFSTNKQGIDNAFKSEEDDNEVSDYIREGAKKAVNVAGGIVNTFPKGVNALSGHTLNLPTIDRFEPKIPFGTQLKEVDAETAERKKQDPNYFISDTDRMALAKEKFGTQAAKQQHLENAAELLNDEDPEVQVRIKSKIINSIKGTTATSKAISAQIQVLDNQATPLSNEISEMEKTIKGGKYTEQFAKDYETKKASFNAISEQYLGLLDDAKKNDHENLTAHERLEVFKLDYNPLVKAADDIVGGFGKMGGDVLYAMGKGADVINETFGVKGREKGDSVFTKGAEILLTDAENRQNAHPHIKVNDINGFTDLGGWVGQTVGAVAPFAVGMAIGSTEASLASKAFLTASPGLMGFSLGAAGGAMSDMDKEMANTPGLDYSNWQYMAKTAGSVGSNALMFGNYAAIFKGNKALFESIGKTPAATVEFKKGFQDYAGDLFNVAKGSNKTGATMALVSGINMFVDNHVLGKKHEGGFEEIADSYVEGVAMHIGTAEAPKALVFMAEKLLPSPTKKAIRSNLGTIHTLMKEINNPDLTPQERTIVKDKIFATHKENTVLLSKSLKDAGKLTGPQVNELLIADQERFDITKKVEDVKKGNFSDEYKKSELNKLKAEFKALDSRTTNVFSDPFNAINILPDAAKRKTEAQRELIKEFNDKNPEGNKKIVLEDSEINERALKNYNKELKEEKSAKLEVEKEQVPIVETPVAETPKAEEVVSPEVVAENMEGQGVSKEVVAPKVAEDISKKSVEDLEKRQAEIEGDKSNSKEFNEIDKELEKREWQSVMLAPLHEVETVLDGLVEKEKTMPNGFGSFIEKRDIRESKAITKKYQGEVSKEDAGKDFKDAFFGNPSSWYADGLKLKESVRAFMEQGGTFKELLQSVQKEFESDGFTEKEAASVINKKLSEVAKANESTPQGNTPTNGDVQPGVKPVGESGVAKPETPAKEGIPSPVDGGESKNTTFKPKEETIKDEKGNPITFYHGSNNEFTDFNESMLGSFTGAESAKEGFFFTDNKSVANSYRQQSIYDSPNTEGLKEVLNGLSKEEIADVGQKLLGNDAKYYYGDLSKQESIGDIMHDIINDTEGEGHYADRNKYIEKASKILKEQGVDLKPYLEKGQIVETHLDIKNPKIVDAKEQLAEEIGLTKIIKEAKEQGHDGVIIKNTYDSISFDEKGNDTQLSDIVVVFDKKQINIKNKPTETLQAKAIKNDVEVSDLDHAKYQIEKGVLQWNGDSGAERINLGITWADIRKGEADIKRGKENTVPAKRLIEALKTAKEKGGYEYTQGKGGITNKQFVSLEDIQKSNNEYELTDAEQKEVAKHEVELAKKYESDFEGLDLQTKIDIYENRENREGNDGLGEKPAPSGESKNDVSKGKEGEGAKPTTKERVAERVKLSDSKIDASSEIVKAKLKAFTDMFPSADINPADYKQNGFSMDAVIDMVAKAAKSIAKGGIVTSEHINEAIKAWNEHFDDVIDAKDIEKIINPKEEPLIIDGEEYFSIKKAEIDAEREEKGKDKLHRVVADERKAEEVRKDIKSKIDSGNLKQEEVNDIMEALATNDVEFKTRFNDGERDAIMLHERLRLSKKESEIRNNLKNTPETIEEYSKLILELAQTELLADQNQQAIGNSGRQAGKNLANRKEFVGDDFTRPAIIKRLEEASKNNELSPEFRKKSGEIAQEIKDLQDKQEEHNTKYEELDAKYKDKESENEDLKEKISKYEAEKKLEKAVKLQGLKDKKEYKIADIEKKQKVVIDRLREKYKNLSGMVNAGINPKFLELAPDVAILAKYEIQKGAVKLEEVIGRVHLQLKDIIPELTERDVRDLFSGYGKSVIPKDVSANEQTLRDLKSKARALSGLQDVKEEGTAPLRSGFKHTTPTPEVLALRREIHREMRARGIDFKNAKDPQAVWKTALESYKTRTQNRLEYFENVTKSNEIEKYLKDKKRTKLKLDDEARALKIKTQKAKYKVDDAVAVLDFETWSKFRKIRHYEIRRARGTLISQAVTLGKIGGAVAWRTAFKIPTAMANYGVSKLKPGIAKVEGINSLKDLTQHIVDYYKTEFSMRNAVESYKTTMNHASAEEILFGKHHGRIPLPKIIGNKELSIRQKISFGHLKFLENISAASHGGLKNLVALPEYEAYKNTIMRNLIKNGIPEDMMNDGSMEQIAHQLAYAKSQRARFGQDNKVASLKTNVEKMLRNNEHHLTADVLDAAMPIVKIASNYIGESFEKYPFIGMTANGKYLLKPSKVLTTKQQGNLLRTLAYQGVGAMQMMLGAMMYKNISAFYGTDADEYAKEQNPDLAKHDGALGVLSHMFAHSPDAEAMRLGASFMWYWEMYDKKNNADKSIMSDFMVAAWQNTAALANQSPYFSASESIIAPFLDSGFSMDSGGKAVVNIIRPRVQFMDAANTVAQGKIPQLEKLSPELAGKISNKLGMIPETVKPYEVKLRAKGFIDNLKMGSPWHRNELLNKLMEERMIPKMQDPENYKKRKENENTKNNNDYQFRREHPKKKK